MYNLSVFFGDSNLDIKEEKKYRRYKQTPWSMDKPSNEQCSYKEEKRKMCVYFKMMNEFEFMLCLPNA